MKTFVEKLNAERYDRVGKHLNTKTFFGAKEYDAKCRGDVYTDKSGVITTNSATFSLSIVASISATRHLKPGDLVSVSKKIRSCRKSCGWDHSGGGLGYATGDVVTADVNEQDVISVLSKNGLIVVASAFETHVLESFSLFHRKDVYINRLFTDAIGVRESFKRWWFDPDPDAIPPTVWFNAVSGPGANVLDAMNISVVEKKFSQLLLMNDKGGLLTIHPRYLIKET